jgi:hypothetical protein
MIGVVVPSIGVLMDCIGVLMDCIGLEKLFGSTGPDLWEPISLLIGRLACPVVRPMLLRCSQRSISSYALCRAALV